jgi:hypothetical protein
MASSDFEAVVMKRLRLIFMVSAVALIASVAALLVSIFWGSGGSGSGPASSLVRFKNASGQDVPAGMVVEAASSTTLPPSGTVQIGAPFDAIPDGNDPGGFLSGSPPVPPSDPNDPGYHPPVTYTPPPYHRVWYFTFQLADGTSFRRVACPPPGVTVGTHIYEVRAVVTHRVDPATRKTFYRMHFDIASAIPPVGSTPWTYIILRDVQTDEVEAGQCLGVGCPLVVQPTPR